MTLIELLVVVSIMLIVTVIAVPAMKPALENRKIREAARSLNVYLGSAHNHAIELGRPVGVLFTRDLPPGNAQYGNACLTLQQVEIPLPYAGDTAGSVATVTASTSQIASGNLSILQITFSPQLTAAYHAGDYIQFNFQGPLYTIAPNTLDPTAPAPTPSAATATILLPSNCWLPWSPSSPLTVPFQITRQPDFSTTNNVTLAVQSAVAPLQLPAGTVIDLQASGTNTGLWFGVGAANPAMLIFSPAGGVYGVFANGTAQPLIDPVYFLIGRRDRMFTLQANVTAPQKGAAGEVVPVDGLANWQDPNNLWVSVTPQTGRITTVENAVVANPTGMSNANAIILARGFALQGQSKGGR